MKRNLAVFTLFVLGLLTAGSSVEAASSYYCAVPYDLSGKPARMFTKVTGANFMSEKIAERILKSEVTKNAEGKFKVGVDSFSFSDLIAGRFKGMRIHGENVVADGVYFSTMDLKTLCDFNYIVYDKKNSTAIFKEDFPLFFGVSISENDLNNTMKAAGYYEMINNLNNFGRTLSLFNIDSTKVKIKDNKFYFVFGIKIPILNTMPNKTFTVAFVSDLNVVNGKVKLDNPELINDFIRVDMTRMVSALNYLNPLEYSLDVMENKNAVLKVQEVKIVNNKINISGIINVPKDVLTQK
ncbi:hypothetical protein DBY21_00780 [Candidatus Gastranaerophilales bacterium]|nr:MAG: hypothetical protein DBY21_00780 [Candidatus Gastranaerophilales bacterium]